MTQPLTVIIADDHPLFRVALRLSVHSLVPAATVMEVDSFESLKQAAAHHRDAGLILLDLMMPGAEGLSSLQFLRTEFPALRVAVVSSLSGHTWSRLVEALGGVAFIHKSTAPEEVQRILARLIAGNDAWQTTAATAPSSDRLDEKSPDPLARLSRQELRVLMHIKDGRLNKQIAGNLGISESTVKTHISTILLKLDLRTRTQAAVLAQRLMAEPDLG